MKGTQKFASGYLIAAITVDCDLWDHESTIIGNWARIFFACEVYRNHEGN